MATTPDPVAEARRALDAERAKLAGWESTRANAAAELATLEDGAGTAVLDDAAAADTIPEQMSRLRDRVSIAARAVAAQGPRVLAAESAYLWAEADALEAPLKAARAVLARHQQKTNELLDQLAEHEGRFVSEWDYLGLRRDAGYIGEGTVRTIPKSFVMMDRIREIERPLAVLRDLAAGVDPAPRLTAWQANPVDVYPPCVFGPEAVVPARPFLDQVENLRTTLQDLLDAQAELPAEIARIRHEGRFLPGEQSATHAAVTRREARLAELDTEIEQVRTSLEGLEPASTNITA